MAKPIKETILVVNGKKLEDFDPAESDLDACIVQNRKIGDEEKNKSPIKARVAKCAFRVESEETNGLARCQDPTRVDDGKFLYCQATGGIQNLLGK